MQVMDFQTVRLTLWHILALVLTNETQIRDLTYILYETWAPVTLYRDYLWFV